MFKDDIKAISLMSEIFKINTPHYSKGLPNKSVFWRPFVLHNQKMVILPEIACWSIIAFWPEWQSIRIELICFFLARNGFSAKYGFLARNGFLINKAYL